MGRVQQRRALARQSSKVWGLGLLATALGAGVIGWPVFLGGTLFMVAATGGGIFGRARRRRAS